MENQDKENFLMKIFKEGGSEKLFEALEDINKSLELLKQSGVEQINVFTKIEEDEDEE